MRAVNVQLAPGFVVQQQQEVTSEERCEERATTIDAEIAPGMREGDELIFARMSEQRPGAIPGDVKLRLKLDPNDSGGGFKRRGDDLHAELRISLRAALLGFQTSLVHLDGHFVRLDRAGVTAPMHVLKVAGEGMPKRDADPPRNGTLHVKILVDFPATLSPEAERLAQLLPD